MPIFAAFATASETAEFRATLAGGLGWGEAKERLAARVEQDLAPLRERYAALMVKPGEIEELLQIGAMKARAIATPLLTQLREAVGLRSLTQKRDEAVAAAVGKSALPQFKQYREADGRFYFKFLDAEGRLLLQSVGLDSPKAAGQCIAALKQARTLAAATVEVQLGPAIEGAAVDAALSALAAAEAEA
jgi:tryptophanyl-tRNA synthetase